MKKGLLFVICTILFVLCLAPAALATADGEDFVTVSWPYPDWSPLEATWPEELALQVRYADDKTPVPLNDFYDGYMFATVPAQYAQRPLEVYQAEGLKFTDIDQMDLEYFTMRELSRVGIIRGDDLGQALPNDAISRAEAVTMILRMLGLDTLEDSEPSGFEDVRSEAWYAKTVAVAEHNGIVSSDKLFNPYRQVSRQEFVTLAARAMERAGMHRLDVSATAEQVATACSIADGELVAPWARPAYALMQTFVPVTGVQTTQKHPEGGYIIQNYAAPQQAATRWECAQLIWDCINRMQVYPSQLAVKYGFDLNMPKIDGSTSTYPFTSAVYRNLFSNGYKHPDLPASHSKSHASYQRLINGQVDMLFASVYPASDILALAKEKGVELELIPIAYDAMVFFTNADNSISGLTSEQITSIYVDNAYANWKDIGGPDAALIPYARNLDSGSQAQMERHFLLDGKQIHEKIQQETTSISMSNVLTDVMGVQSDDPPAFGLGYSIYYYYHNMDMFYGTLSELKLLAIDGVLPTDQTIADGSYPLSNNTYVVLRADTPASSPARKMADFMLSPTGQECVKEAAAEVKIADRKGGRP